MRDSFLVECSNEKNAKWEKMVERRTQLYSRGNDIRSEFERDYTRIIHCQAYRRMRHKTQVFFSPSIDHICTRMEHVILVESISHTISNYLGLNNDLTKAIAMAHDIGHSPFGHQGEHILSEISKKDLGKTFWHERNGMELVDKVELLEDDKKNMLNLNLTYAVRDGIISHCGEIDENSLMPRDEYIDLYKYDYPNQYNPYTWEGCVVKISDKIAYLGRDIQDAITFGIIDEHLRELYDLIGIDNNKVINNTVIINKLVYDICENSNPKVGLKFSSESYDFMNKLKEFNYKYIYKDERLIHSTKYFELIINTIYEVLKEYYSNKEKVKKYYPQVINDFEDWLKMYWNDKREKIYLNDSICDLNEETEFYQAIIYYISGMTDNFAIDTYNKIIGF